MEVCNVCGISEVQTDITQCSIREQSLCPLCCLLSRGEKVLVQCCGCEFGEPGLIGA